MDGPMADEGYLSVQVIQQFYSKNLNFCACAGTVIQCAGNRPENTIATDSIH